MDVVKGLVQTNATMKDDVLKTKKKQILEKSEQLNQVRSDLLEERLVYAIREAKGVPLEDELKNCKEELYRWNQFPVVNNANCLSGPNDAKTTPIF